MNTDLEKGQAWKQDKAPRLASEQYENTKVNVYALVRVQIRV